jgi:hypothetical protein
MDYTLQAIVQRVKVDKLDDDEFDTGVITRFVNDAQRDIFNQFELTFQEKIFAGTLPASSTMFSVPDDLALLQRAILTNGTDIQDISKKYMPWREFLDTYPSPSSNTAGDVSNWTSYAGNIILNCPQEDEQTLTMYYIKKPIVLTTGTQVPEIPEEFSELLVLGAYIRCLKFNEDFDQAAYVEIEYNKNLDLLVTRYGGRISPGSIKMANQQIKLRRR